MKNFKNKLIAIATVSLLGTGAVQAETLAYSNLDIVGMMFTDGSNNQLIQGTDITILNYANSTTNTADLSSVSGIQGSSILGQQVCQPTCAGLGGYGEQGGTNNHFARAMSDLNGSIVEVGGATARTMAESQLTANDVGASTSGIQLLAGFTFSLTQATQIGVKFDTVGFLHTLIGTSSTVPPSSAQASVNFNINILDNNGVTVFDWSPDGVNGNAIMANDIDQAGVSLNQGLASAFSGQDFTRSLAGSWSAVSVASFAADINYTLKITHSSVINTTNHNAIPEPSVLALLTLGLAGFRLRKRKS